MTPTLAEITRELLKTYNLRPKKRLGQHFLIDPKVLQRIIDAAQLSSEDTVLEIGTGLGVLTAELAKRAKQVITVEVDKDLIKIAKDVLKSYNNIIFIQGDILKLGLPFYNKVVANLPYYITAPIIERLLEVGKRVKGVEAGIDAGSRKKEVGMPQFLTSTSHFQTGIHPQNQTSKIILTVQKEVAERMAAGPGSKKYGSFSIFVQYHAEVKLDSFVSKSSFYPWPEVSSAIVILRPYPQPKYKVKDEKLFFDIVHAAFQQRRKKLKNSLAKYNLEKLDIDLNRRPETLSIEEFAALANYCYNSSS